MDITNIEQQLQELPRVVESDNHLFFSPEQTLNLILRKLQTQVERHSTKLLPSTLLKGQVMNDKDRSMSYQIRGDWGNMACRSSVWARILGQKQCVSGKTGYPDELYSLVNSTMPM